VSRVAALGLLFASGMIALGQPAIDLVFTGGRFSAAESRECAAFFAVFSISMFLWSAQAIYARAFYATGDTVTPMVAGTIVTIVSWPIYVALFHLHGAMGLAFASDIGIALQTVTIALLLHHRRMVSLASLDLPELGRCLIASLTSGAAVWIAVWAIGVVLSHMHGAIPVRHARALDLLVLVAGTAVWFAITKEVLERSGSALPRVVMKRLRLS
jgi:putative peptidoglycan lipid II flippase